MVARRNTEIGKLTPHPNRGKVPKRFARIKNLRCRDELDSMIRAGYSIPKVAKWLQEEMCEYSDVSQASLVTTLCRYRNEMPAGDLLMSNNQAVAARARKEAEEGLDELNETERLYLKQMERIALGMRMERGRRKRGKEPSIPPMLSKQLTQDFAVALQILARRHDIKMDLGIQGGRQIGTLNIRPELEERLREKYGEDVQRALKRPESRAKVLSIVEQIQRRVHEQEAEAKTGTDDEGDLDPEGQAD